MRVWLAPSRYAPHLGGIETVVAQLAQELAAAGHEVLVVTHRHPRELPAGELIDGVHVRRLRFEAPARNTAATRRFLASYRSLPHALDQGSRPDVIHIHGASTQSLHLARYARRRGIPLVLTTHGEITGDVHDVYGRSAYVRASFRYAARQARAVTAPSRQTLDEAARLSGAVAGKGVVVPNGIRSEKWHGCASPTASHRVLAWGRLEPQKGFDRLLRAWPLVRERLPDAELRIAGDGAQRDALLALLSPGASLLGRLDHAQLRAELGAAQLAAVPSRVEAFGMSALEALAGGRRVLHTGIPALAEVVGEHGWSVPGDEPAAMSAAVVAALTETPKPVPAAAVRRFEWHHVVSAYQRLYGV